MTMCFDSLHPTLTNWQAIAVFDDLAYLDIVHWQRTWQAIDTRDDQALTDWLIALFAQVFGNHTQLVRGGDEPIYLSATHNTKAQIVFANGYFQSALHEIAHWCLAGQKRRQQDDFGYWYAPDGRDDALQRLFEQVEIRPQAIECLLSLATNRSFRASQDNLAGGFDQQRFAIFQQNIYQQAMRFIHNQDKLSTDAKRLIGIFLTVCHNPPISFTTA